MENSKKMSGFGEFKAKVSAFAAAFAQRVQTAVAWFAVVRKICLLLSVLATVGFFMMMGSRNGVLVTVFP